MTQVPLEQDPQVRRSLDEALRAAFGPAEERWYREVDLDRGRGSYRILGEIARGGMGVILRGRDPELARDVAVKVLREDLAGDSAIARRFVEEAKIGGQLQHPGIVPIYEFGRMADRRPYFAMKLIRGRTLAALLAERTSLEQDRHRFLGIFERVCQTMAYAHSRGVVHRDLKPANVMVGSFGEVQIVDWGLAKVLSSAPGADGEPPVASARRGEGASASHSVAGAVMGTPAYMPPEQARGETHRVDERSDVFALGGILCDLLTGAPPYAGPSDAAKDAAARGEIGPAFERLAAVRDEPELSALCRRCLSLEIEARPRDAAEVARALGAHLASIDERARAAQIAAAEARVKVEQERKARRLTLALAASILLALGAGGGAWLWVARQADLRQTRNAERVGAALDHATLLFGQARTSADAARWREALAAVAEAEAMLGAGDAGAGIEQRARELAGTIRSEAEDARRRADLERSNRELLVRMHELRAPESQGPERTDWSKFDADYAVAFREHGLDLEARSIPDLADEIRTRGLGVDAAVALDEWAYARRRGGDARGAETLTQLALAADPDAARTRLRAALARGDAADVVEFAKHARLETLPVATLSLLGNVLEKGGAPDEALRVLKVAQEVGPDDYVTHVYLARLAWDRDRSEAARCYTAALALRPGDPLVIREFGWLLDHFLREPERAISLYRRVLDQRPEDATLHLYVGHALLDSGDVEGAAAAYRETLRIEPKRISARLGLLDCLRQEGNSDELIAACRDLIRESPEYGGPHYRLGEALLARGAFEEAAEAFEQALRILPADSRSRDGLRRALEPLGDGDGALQAAREAQHAEPDLLLEYVDLGIRVEEIVDVDAALRERRESAGRDPASAAEHAMLAVLLEAKGLYAEALREFQAARDLGSRASGWTAPSQDKWGRARRLILVEHRADRWVEEAERLAAFEERFDAVSRGEEEPASGKEWAEHGRLALRRGRTFAAARMFSKALPEGFATDAIAAAASAGCGRGEDAGNLEASERSRLRGEAATWMQADLARRAEQADSADAAVRSEATRTLARWVHDPALACVREPESIASLPDDERVAWRSLWAEVDILRARLRGPRPGRGR